MFRMLTNFKKCVCWDVTPLPPPPLGVNNLPGQIYLWFRNIFSVVVLLWVHSRCELVSASHESCIRSNSYSKNNPLIDIYYSLIGSKRHKQMTYTNVKKESMNTKWVHGWRRRKDMALSRKKKINGSQEIWNDLCSTQMQRAVVYAPS